MKIVLMANNYVGLEVLRFLRSQNAEICALIVHPEEKSQFREDIIHESKLPVDRVFSATHLKDETFLDTIKELQPDLGLSVFFGYILRDNLINIFPKGVLNLHPAYLPWNRGAYPNVWSIVDETPAGVTLHYIDSGIDTGDIVAKQKVDEDPSDNGLTLYKKLEQACIDVFKKEWESIKSDHVSRIKQDFDSGSHHFLKDINQIDAIDLEKKYVAKDLLNILRARTFPPHKGAYFQNNGKKYYLQLNIIPEEQDGSQ